MGRVKHYLVLGGLISLPLLFVGLVGVLVDTFGEGECVLGLGIITTVISTLSIERSLSRRLWPITDGLVTHVKVETTPGLFGWRDAEQDRVCVEYSYTVEGEEHTGLFKRHPNDGQLTRQVGGYLKEGTALTVRYNPAKPSDSLVLLGPRSISFWFLMLGLAGIVGGCFSIWK